MKAIRTMLQLLLITAMAAPAAMAGQVLYTADLKAGNEIPATTSTATAVAVLTIQDDNVLAYSIAASGFAAPDLVTAAQLHVGGPTASGPVRHTLEVAGNGTGSGIIQLSAVERAQFQHTELYLNLLTAKYPQGAIRGQVKLNPAPALRYQAHLNGLNEVPHNSSKATAKATVFLDPASGKLAYFVQASGFGAAPNAVISGHIHSGGASVSGSVLIPFVVDAAGKGSGIVFANSAQKSALLRNELYVNLHTAQFPGGAIRGQLEFDPGPPTEFAYFRNHISGSIKITPELNPDSPHILNAQAQHSGRLADLLDMALTQDDPTPREDYGLQVKVVPLFDPAEFPNGPVRVIMITPHVTVDAGDNFSEFMIEPGLEVPTASIPDGISQADFRNTYFQDYTVSIDGVDINPMSMASSLIGPVVVGGEQIGEDATTPSVSVTAYNTIFKINSPGSYIVGVRWKTLKTLADAKGNPLEKPAEVNIAIPLTLLERPPAPPYLNATEALAPASGKPSSARNRLNSIIWQALEEYAAGRAPINP